MTASSSAIITLRVQLTLPTVTAANRPTIVVKIQLFRDMQWLMIQSHDSSILRAKQSIRFDDSVTGQLRASRPTPLPSNRHHRSDGDCLEGKRENYQVCSVQYCVQLCTVPCTLIWTALTVLWIGFCLTGPISLCLDSFLYCVLLCVVCMRRFVTWWGGPGGIEAYP